MDQGGWQEYVEARMLFQEAASAGSGAAMYNLGLLYINGWGVTRDYAQAHDWFQKAANRGSSRAMNRLGLMYYHSDKLPTFFPPRATDSVVLPFQFASKKWTLQNVADHLSDALREAGYWGKCSYYWLEDRHGPGFAIVTHIEHIQPDGKPVLDQRWGFDLPRYGQLTLDSMLKALIHADPGRYRLLALVVCKEPLVEKETPMTTRQVQELNAGPKWLPPDQEKQTVVPNEDFHLIAYVYEFERKSRSDDPALMVSSNLTAQQHLQSTALYDDIEECLSK